jgi:glycosyltransferase involved in cell wall biosynthesis
MMKEMGLKARAAVENYTWEANARQILAIYRKTLIN